MRFRKLRVAWSVAWGLVAVLLIVLWVRSYSYLDSTGPIPKHTFVSFRVRLWLDPLLAVKSPKVSRGFEETAKQRPVVLSFPHDAIFDCRRLNGTDMPIWTLVLLATTFATAPWIGWFKRFSLRALLIVTTLVAVVLGLIVYATR